MPDYLPRTDILIHPPYPITVPDYLRHKSPVLPPEHDPDHLPLRCVYFSREYVPFLLAVIDYYCHPDQFIGTPGEQALAVERFETLRAMFMSNSDECEGAGMLQFRQSIYNPCRLEYSTDGGSVWLLAFDYSKCARRGGGIDISIDTVGDTYVSNQVVFNTYNGDIVNVAPEWNYGDPDDVYRDMALCWAAEKWIELCAKLAIQAGEADAAERQEKMYWISSAFNILGDVASAMADMDIYKSQAQILAVLAEVGATIVTVVASFAEFDPAALSDQDAQTQVACHIYDALAGSKPTFAAWQSALQNHGMIGNEGQIADAAYAMMQSEELYVQYLIFAADIVPAAQIAGDLGCPCDEAWEVIADLTAQTLPDWLTIDWGNHEIQIGVTCVPHQAQGYTQRSLNLTFTPLTTNWTLTNVLAEYAALQWGDLPSSYPGIVFQGTRSDPPVPYVAASWPKSTFVGSSGTKETNVNVTQVQTIQAFFRVSKFDSSGAGALRTIRLRGLGDNPFIP